MTEIVSLFKPELIFLNFDAENQKSLFEQLNTRLIELGYIHPGWLEAIQEREDQFPTGLAFPTVSVALPHVDPEFIIKPYIAIIVPKDAIEFLSMDGEGRKVLAHYIFNLGVCKDVSQVQVLAKLMDFFMNAEAVAVMKKMESPSELYSYLNSYMY